MGSDRYAQVIIAYAHVENTICRLILIELEVYALLCANFSEFFAFKSH